MTLSCTAIRASTNIRLFVCRSDKRSGDTVQCSCDAESGLTGAVLGDAWLDRCPDGLKPALVLLLRAIARVSKYSHSSQFRWANLDFSKLAGHINQCHPDPAWHPPDSEARTCTLSAPRRKCTVVERRPPATADSVNCAFDVWNLTQLFRLW